MRRSKYYSGLVLTALMISVFLVLSACAGSSGGSSTAATTPSTKTTAVATATPLGSVIPTESIISAPVMGHSAEKFYDCLKCHNPGRIEHAPADHAGYTNNDCRKCHVMGD